VVRYSCPTWPRISSLRIGSLLAVLVLIVIAKPATKFATIVLAGHPLRVALTVAAGLGQIGEFSFIIGTMGLSLGLLPRDGFQLIVAGALLSIAANPLLLRLIDPLEARLRARPLIRRLGVRGAGALTTLDPATAENLRLHAIVCGYGRVGRMIGPALERRGFRYVVVTQQRDEVDRLRARGIPAIYGDASVPEVLDLAHVADARLLVVTVSDPHETRLIVEQAQAAHPGIDVVARTHSDSEAAHLRSLGAKVQVVHGERELAVQMARYALRRFGVSATEAEAVAQGLRGRPIAVAEGTGGGDGRLARLRAWWAARASS
jgi:CPA2 family monovalent cation:H+ antiporter-2